MYLIIKEHLSGLLKGLTTRELSKTDVRFIQGATYDAYEGGTYRVVLYRKVPDNFTVKLAGRA